MKPTMIARLVLSAALGTLTFAVYARTTTTTAGNHVVSTETTIHEANVCSSTSGTQPTSVATGAYVTSASVSGNTVDCENPDEGSSGVTTKDALRNIINQNTNTVFARMRRLRRLQTSVQSPSVTSSGAGAFSIGMNSGRAAGEGLFGNAVYGAWASYGRSDLDNKSATTEFDGKINLGTAGVDISPMDSLMIGLAFSWEDGDYETIFNGGEQETDGYTIMPYIGYSINNMFSVDVTGGYSDIETEQFRTPAGFKVDSDVDSDRWFIAANLNMTVIRGNWVFEGRTGGLYSEEEQDSYRELSGGVVVNSVAERTYQLGQWSIGGDVGYTFEVGPVIGALEPYAGAFYRYDFDHDDVDLATVGALNPPNDEDDVLFEAGMRWFGSQNATGTLTWRSTLGREEIDDDTFSLNLRLEF